MKESEAKEIYNKAIEDFMQAIDKADREGVLDFSTIEGIAEQLKGSK